MIKWQVQGLKKAIHHVMSVLFLLYEFHSGMHEKDVSFQALVRRSKRANDRPVNQSKRATRDSNASVVMRVKQARARASFEYRNDTRCESRKEDD